MDDSCTIYKTSEFVGKRWTILILLELYRDGMSPKRFNSLKASLPNITQKILSERLKELEEEGLVSKKVDSTSFPVKSEYSLTKAGCEFMDVIKTMKTWALKWKIRNKLCKSTDCINCSV